MKLLECKNLNIGYNHISVCKNISFTLKKGNYMCVGDNGSGKSTLIKTLLGLEQPLSGSIVFDKKFNKNNIGYLPQQSELQKDFPAIVSEVVMTGFLNNMAFRPFYKKAEKEKAADIMRTLGIEELQFSPYRELSGGQQQRVLLARALCATNQLLVLDEPTTGLDATSVEGFYKLLKQLNEEGITVLMISHNIEKVLQFASHIVLLKNEMVFAGSKEEFLKTPYSSMYKDKKGGL